jgi:hypothetical protein
LWLDEDSEKILGFYDAAHRLDSLQATGTIVPNAPGDMVREVFFPRITGILSDNAKVVADAHGQMPRSVLQSAGLKILLENEFISVVSNASKLREYPVDLSKLASDSSAFSINDGPSLEERNVFYWLTQARKYVVEQLKFEAMGYQLAAYTHYGHDYDNAFFMPTLKTLSFGTGGKILKNTALSRDVIIHEFGHAVTQEIYGTYASYEFNAMNEAFSDYLAAAVTNDPVIAEGAMQERTLKKHLRTIENQMVYPTHFSGKSFHEDGQMFSAALWDLRKTLGAERTDAMVHEARLAQAKTISEFLRELLVIDEREDDQNPFTSSKNERAIWKAFKNHGLVSDVRFQKAPTENLTLPWKREGCLGVY